MKYGLQTFNDGFFPFLQVQLAEMEALSLNSDKSSSILLGDESDNRSTSQLSPKETKVSPRWSWACCTLYFCACFSEVFSIHPSVPPEEYKCWSLFKKFSIEEKKKGCTFLKVFFTALSNCLGTSLILGDLGGKPEDLSDNLKIPSESALPEALINPLCCLLLNFTRFCLHLFFSNRMARTALTPLG